MYPGLHVFQGNGAPARPLKHQFPGHSQRVTQEAAEGPRRPYLRCSWAGELEGTSSDLPRNARAQCTLTKSPASSQTLKGVSLPTAPCPLLPAPHLPPGPADLSAVFRSELLSFHSSVHWPQSPEFGPSIPRTQDFWFCVQNKGAGDEHAAPRCRKPSLPPVQVGSVQSWAARTVARPSLQGPTALQRTGSTSRKKPL